MGLSPKVDAIGKLLVVWGSTLHYTSSSEGWRLGTRSYTPTGQPCLSPAAELEVASLQSTRDAEVVVIPHWWWAAQRRASPVDRGHQLVQFLLASPDDRRR